MYISEHGNCTATHCSCCGEAFLVKGTGREGADAAHRALDEHISQSDKCEVYYDNLPTFDDVRGILQDETPPPHAPASTATSEVIEKYARSITNNNGDILKSFEADEVSPVARDILTRFASEIGTVDAEKVWDELWAIYVKLNGPFEDRDDYEEIITISKTDLAAAMQAAKGDGV